MTGQSQSLSVREKASAIAAGAIAALVVGSLVALAAPFSVSQKGREFSPAKVSIKRGETVQILNDDADLRHHAYIDSDKFSFDSGDQEPGTKAVITFPIVGDFEVLCAIHPKMKLAVQVK
jgi:plastocyanin